MAMSLPTIDYVRKSFGDVFSDVPGFLRQIWIIGLLYGACSILPLLFSLLTHGPDNTTNTFPNGIALLVGMLVQFVVSARFMNAWFGKELRGENPGTPIPMVLGTGEKRMMITLLKIFGLLFLPFGILLGLVEFIGLLAGPLMLALAAAVFYASCRVTLAAPLTVLDEPAPVKRSWDITRPHVWSIAAGIVVLAIAFFVPFWIVFAILRIVVGFLLPSFLAGLIFGLIHGFALAVFSVLAMHFNVQVLRAIQPAG